MQRLVVVALAQACLTGLVPAASHAAGYFSGTKGATAAGRGGAFTVAADDLSAVVFNPAGLARLQSPLVIQVGNRFSYNGFDYTRDPTLDWGHTGADGVPPYVTFSTVHNQTPWQALDPLMGVAARRGDWGFALAALAPPGVGRQTFPQDGGQRYMMVAREAIILNYSATVAWQYRERFGIGASLQWIHVPRLNYSIVIEGTSSAAKAFPVSSDLDMLAEVKGSDLFTPNAVLGAWFKAWPFLEFGASGQILPTSIKTQSRVSVAPINPKVGQVRLLRDGEAADDVSLTLPLPLTARLGVRYLHERAGRRWFDLELNVGYESWSRVDRLALQTNGLGALHGTGQYIDLGTITVDKQWKDTFSVHLGGDVIVLPGRLTLRAGLFHESAVAARKMSNVDFVSGRQLGGAVGGSAYFGRWEIAAAYEFRRSPQVYLSERDAGVYQQAPGSKCVAPPYDDPAVCNEHYLGRPAPAVNAGTYAAQAHVASLDLLYRF